MIKISIQGISDGKREIDMVEPVEEVENIFPEFFGDIEIKGEMIKIGNRYTITGTANCSTELVCDRSLKSFTEDITADFKLSYIADTNLYLEQSESDVAEFEKNIIHEESKYIDITEEIRDVLALALPMKRIAPELRDKDIDEIYPEHTKPDDISDDRWAPLKNLKNDNSN